MRAAIPRRWDIFASVVLRRDPVIASSLTILESSYQQMQYAQEQENSLLCDFELKAKKDKKLLEKRAQLEREGKELSELDGELGITNAMLEDEWNKKSKIVQQKYLQNTSLEKDDRNIWRELDRKIVLVVQQRFGQDKYSSPWILPQTKHIIGESLRQTAERCIASMLTSNTQATITNNAPFSVHTHRYPNPLTHKTGSYGAKIFFYNAVIIPRWENLIVKNKEIHDFKWLNSEEFWKTVSGKSYKMMVRSALLE